MNQPNALFAYFAELTSALPSALSPEAFEANQLLPELAEQECLQLARDITYHIAELDVLETIPVSMLKFKGMEQIDAEHVFLFFEGSAGNWYNPLLAAKQVLRATAVVVCIAGKQCLLVQQVDAVSEKSFEREHQPMLSKFCALAS